MNSSIKTSTAFTLKPVPKIHDLPPIRKGEDLLKDKSIAEPEELIPGLLHRATKAVIAGPSKIGKTWLLLYLAVCVATGTQFLRWATRASKVLFINLEVPTAFMKQRLQAVLHALGLNECGSLEMWNLRGKAGDPEALIANIIQHTQGKNYDVIVIDPLYKLFGARSENNAGAVGVVCNMNERLAEKTGTAIVCSHHFPKGNAKKKSTMDRLSGSGVFARDADTIVTLTPHSEENGYTMEFILRNFPQQDSFVVERNYPLIIERPDLDPEDVRIEDVDDVDDHGLLEIVKVRSHTTAEWEIKAKAAGISRATFYRIKRKLKEHEAIDFDFASKEWFAVEQKAPAPTAVIDIETVETSEAVETSEPVVPEIAGTGYKLEMPTTN